HQLRGRHCNRVQRRLSPSHFHRQLGEINDAAVAAVAALVVRRAHEDAIDRTGIDAQRTEHALGVIDLETVYSETLAHRVLDLIDVDAVYRAGTGALIAADAGRQIEAMEPAIARLHRHRQLRVFKMLREGLALVGLQEIPESDVHSLGDGVDRPVHVTEPL